MNTTKNQNYTKSVMFNNVNDANLCIFILDAFSQYKKNFSVENLLYLKLES